MKDRFEGTNRPQLLAVLGRQEIAYGSPDAAEALASVGELVEYAIGSNIISQDAQDNDVYLLIAGAVGVVVNGAQIATRRAGQFVGEMAAIEPSLPRSATVTVLEPTLALKISSSAFLGIANKVPVFWQNLAMELSKRLYQRNSQIFPPNPSPKLFIISSSEAKDVAHAIADGLAPEVFSTVWDEGVFFAGGYPLEALEKQVGQSDFAVAIAEPDDISESRGQRAPTVRDNVLFELGLFMGKLTRHRTILVHPRVAGLKLPSDLQGLTLIPYDPGDTSTVNDRLKTVCDNVRELVGMRGTRTFSVKES